MNFDPHRGPDGAIDLDAALADYVRQRSMRRSRDEAERAGKYLRDVAAIYPITSRQAAAVAMATALWLARE